MGIFNLFGKGADRDGQPQVKAFRSEAVVDRQIDELIGLVKGVMADGMVHQQEAEFLLRWMTVNRAAMDKWPAKAIYPRIAAALADGVMTLEEEGEIMDVLLATVGGNTAPMQWEGSNSTALPYCKPLPELTHEGKTFCFTGKFNAGSRVWCEQQVLLRGGAVASNITKKLHYLVIGEIGSRDWVHSTHGRKIEKAVEYKDQGTGLNIVPEQHWFESLSAA